MVPIPPIALLHPHPTLHLQLSQALCLGKWYLLDSTVLHGQGEAWTPLHAKKSFWRTPLSIFQWGEKARKNGLIEFAKESPTVVEVLSSPMAVIEVFSSPMEPPNVILSKCKSVSQVTSQEIYFNSTYYIHISCIVVLIIYTRVMSQTTHLRPGKWQRAILCRKRRPLSPATGIAKEALTKAVQVPELAHFSCTPIAKVIIR